MYVGLKTNNGGRGALFAKIKLLLRLPRLYVSGGHKGLGGVFVPKLYPSTIKNTKFLNGYKWTPKARHYLWVFGFLRGRIHEGGGGGGAPIVCMYMYMHKPDFGQNDITMYCIVCTYVNRIIWAYACVAQSFLWYLCTFSIADGWFLDNCVHSKGE